MAAQGASGSRIYHKLHMAHKSGKILIVDDNAGIRRTLEILLPLHFDEVYTIASPSKLVVSLERIQPDVVLLDMNFEAAINTGNEGLFWLEQIKGLMPNVEVVLFTAYADIQLAVEGMKRGAFDFITKPWQNDKLIEILTHARDKARGKHSASTQQHQMFWGDSVAMQAIQHTLSKIAPTEVSVLITGENGTGKDVLAHEIHAQSTRCNMPMVAVDVGAIADTLFESELFGHVKGAFTDAHADHMGKFEQADGGTLFLDEIGNIPPHLQAKLLRAIQNRCITRVGGSQSKQIDIRLVCATNMDLEQMIREGRFREDLYYRISTVRLALPPLRERLTDIVPLAQNFVHQFAAKYHRPIKGIAPQAQAMLQDNRWSGNIRELQNCMEKAVILSEGPLITCSDLQLAPDNCQFRPSVHSSSEEQRVRVAMQRCGGNVSAAAKMLGISRPTLYTKLKKYGL